jgi:hypothetical protein
MTVAFQLRYKKGNPPAVLPLPGLVVLELDSTATLVFLFG